MQNSVHVCGFKQGPVALIFEASSAEEIRQDAFLTLNVNGAICCLTMPDAQAQPMECQKHT